MKKKKNRKCRFKSIKNKKWQSNDIIIAVCCKQRSRFMTEEKAKGILSSLSLKTLLSNIPLSGDALF